MRVDLCFWRVWWSMDMFKPYLQTLRHNQVCVLINLNTGLRRGGRAVKQIVYELLSETINF